MARRRASSLRHCWASTMPKSSASGSASATARSMRCAPKGSSEADVLPSPADAGEGSSELRQPALAPAVVLEVAVRLACADLVEPEIELLDIGVLAQALGRALEDDAAILHDIAMVGDVERHARVLLDQKHGQLPLFAQPADDAENLLDQQRRQAERGLVEQDHLGLGHQCPANHQHLLLAAR